MRQNEASLLAIKSGNVGPAGWWRIGGDLPRICRKSRAGQRVRRSLLSGTNSRLRAAYFPGQLHPDIGRWEMPRNEASLFATNPQNGRHWLAANWPRYPRSHQKIAHLPVGVNGPTFWALLADKDGLYLAHCQPDIGRGEMPLTRHP